MSLSSKCSHYNILHLEESNAYKQLQINDHTKNMLFQELMNKNKHNQNAIKLFNRKIKQRKRTKMKTQQLEVSKQVLIAQVENIDESQNINKNHEIKAITERQIVLLQKKQQKLHNDEHKSHKIKNNKNIQNTQMNENVAEIKKVKQQTQRNRAIINQQKINDLSKGQLSKPSPELPIVMKNHNKVMSILFGRSQPIQNMIKVDMPTHKNKKYLTQNYQESQNSIKIQSYTFDDLNKGQATIFQRESCLPQLRNIFLSNNYKDWVNQRRQQKMRDSSSFQSINILNPPPTAFSKLKVIAHHNAFSLKNRY